MSDEGVCKMAISYNKLWKLLIDNKMSKKDFLISSLIIIILLLIALLFVILK